MTTKSLIGVVVAGIAVFMWGFAFWGASTLGYSTWKSPANDAQAQAELASLFQQTGHYGIPSIANNTPEESAALLKSGVWATVNIVHDPAPAGDPTSMLLGLAHNILVMFLLALLIKHMHANRLRTAVLVGLTATVFSNLGDVIWWNYPIEWKGTVMLYDMGYWVLGGLVLSYFMRESAS